MSNPCHPFLACTAISVLSYALRLLSLSAPFVHILVIAPLVVALESYLGTPIPETRVEHPRQTFAEPNHYSRRLHRSENFEFIDNIFC